MTTEAPCQITYERASFYASLGAGATMATCPLHVFFASGPELDSTITISGEASCCGPLWTVSSPVFEQPTKPGASPSEAGDDALEARELGDASQEQESTDVSLDKEAIDAADASIE